MFLIQSPGSRVFFVVRFIYNWQFIYLQLIIIFMIGKLDTYLILAILVTMASGLTFKGSHQLRASPEHELKLFGKIASPCPDGETPYDNGIEVTSNGCGPGDTQSKIASWFAPYMKTLTPCCDQHDYCFETCASSNFADFFNKCNSDFKTCMYSRCEEYAQSSTSWVKRLAAKAACKSSAYSYYQLVQKGGKTAFQTAQKKHCSCKSHPPSEEQSESEE